VAPGPCRRSWTSITREWRSVRSATCNSRNTTAVSIRRWLFNNVHVHRLVMRAFKKIEERRLLISRSRLLISRLSKQYFFWNDAKGYPSRRVGVIPSLFIKMHNLLTLSWVQLDIPSHFLV
jgi:hypothetical protein